MDTKEAAKILHCRNTSVERIIRRGDLKAVKVGRTWDVSKEDLDDFITHRPKRNMDKLKHDVKIGDIFGYWTVIGPAEYNEFGARSLLCRCVCGKEKLVRIQYLIRGKSKSCGCKRHLMQTNKQKTSLQEGQKVMQKIHAAKAVPGLRYFLGKNSTTGHMGVCFAHNSGSYRAYITVNRKQIHLGIFPTLEEAIRARKAAEEKYLTPLPK